MAQATAAVEGVRDESDAYLCWLFLVATQTFTKIITKVGTGDCTLRLGRAQLEFNLSGCSVLQGLSMAP